MENETPMQDLFRRFGHMLPDIENEFLTKEKVVLQQPDVIKSVCGNLHHFSDIAHIGRCEECLETRKL